MQDLMQYCLGDMRIEQWFTRSRDFPIYYRVPAENDWERTRFVSGGGSVPSKATRAKLRAKRKKK